MRRTRAEFGDKAAGFLRAVILLVLLVLGPLLLLELLDDGNDVIGLQGVKTDLTASLMVLSGVEHSHDEFAQPFLISHRPPNIFFSHSH